MGATQTGDQKKKKKEGGNGTFRHLASRRRTLDPVLARPGFVCLGVGGMDRCFQPSLLLSGFCFLRAEGGRGEGVISSRGERGEGDETNKTR